MAEEESARLRADLRAAAGERDRVSAELVTLRTELERYKDCTGHNIDELEKEKTARAALQSEYQTQVSPVWGGGGSLLLDMLRRILECVAAASWQPVNPGRTEVSGSN